MPSERIRLLPDTAPGGYCPLAPEQAPEYASLIPQDGFRLMFAAATLLQDRRDLHWVIIGSGRDEERVRHLVRNKGLDNNFHFLGRHPAAAMPKILLMMLR